MVARREEVLIKILSRRQSGSAGRGHNEEGKTTKYYVMQPVMESSPCLCLIQKLYLFTTRLHNFCTSMRIVSSEQIPEIKCVTSFFFFRRYYNNISFPQGFFYFFLCFFCNVKS